MWQLHHRWQQAQLRDEERQTEQVRLESFRVRRMLIVGVLLVSGVTGGLVGSRVMNTPLAITLASLGGMALALLLIAIPAQALRVLLRGLIAVGIARRRRRMRGLVKAELAELAHQRVGHLPAPVLCDVAVAEYLRGGVETAEAELAHALEISPDEPCLLNNLGVILAIQAQYERAAELFVRALGQSGEGEAAMNCAFVAPRVEDPAWLQRLLEEQGALHPVALNNLGVAYAQKGDWDLGERCFAASVSAEAHPPAARANLGLMAYRGGHLQNAADQIMQANRMAPREPAFANHLGVILAAAGQIDQARVYLRRAHRVDPASVPIRINMLAVDAAGHHWHVACKGFHALSHHVETYRQDILYNLALSELATQQPVAAAHTAAQAIAAGDASADAYTVLAVSLWETGRRAEALSHFQSALRAEDSGPLAVSNLARALMLEHRTSEAQALLEEALGRWPDEPSLTLDHATAVLADATAAFHEELSLTERQLLAARIQRVLPAFEAALQRGESAAEAHVNIGLYRYMQEQFEGAAEHFEAAARLIPKLAELSFLAGTALAREGEKQSHRTEDGDTAPTPTGRGFLRRAIPYLEAAAEAREVMLDASYNLGRCLYVLKDFERSLTAFRRGTRLEGGDQLAVMAALSSARQAQKIQLLLRTQLLSDAKREQLRERSLELLNIAVHYFRQALLRNEMDATLHGNLGIAYMLRNRENDVEAALRHWERMRAIGGGAMQRRYRELALMENLADPTRVGFDDRSLKIRGLVVGRWVAVPPPRPPGVRFVLEPVAVQQSWRLAAQAPRLLAALELRDQIAALQLRLQQLRV